MDIMGFNVGLGVVGFGVVGFGVVGFGVVGFGVVGFGVGFNVGNVVIMDMDIIKISATLMGTGGLTVGFDDIGLDVEGV